MRALFVSVVPHWEQAGYGAYPLAVLYVVMLWIAARQLRRLLRARRHVRVAVPLALTSLRASHDVGDALGTMAALGSTLARSVAAGLAQLPTSSVAVQLVTRGKRDADLALLDRRAHALPILASLSTLFGLFGTITGMIRPGGSCAPPNVHSRAQWFALNIGESMNCVAFALLLAVLCVALDGLLDAWRLRLRADVEHALALLDSEVDALRPHLRFFGAHIPDERQGYRGA